MVPLRVGGGRDRTWRESAAGRREGLVRSGGPHLGGGDLGDGTSARLSVGGGGRSAQAALGASARPRAPRPGLPER